MMNLLSNAVKFSPQGQTVSISIEEQAHAIRVNVSDCGSGIPDSLQPIVFNQFVRDKQRSKGSGLGLSIAKTIIEAHGGSIDFKTSPEGTTFYFDLPR
jgi:signal transduction histidine kinase